MIDKREQQLISDALQKAHLTELPKKANNKSVWIEGIAKIRLANNSIAYGIVKRNYDLTSRVVYVNGDISAINSIEEVYPYIILDKGFIHKFEKGEKPEAARIAYLKSQHLPWAMESNYFDDMDIDQLNKEVVKAALYAQLKAMEG